MLSVISLFTGAGGLDLGFEAAGFRTAVAVEFDPDAVATLRASDRAWPVIERDIHAVPSRYILKEAGFEAGEADVLIGGPPCQPFSKSGYWASGDTLRLDDPRAGTLAAFLRVVRDTLPSAFLLENVPGLAYRKKSEGLDLVQRTIDQINKHQRTDYVLAVAKLNAADYGVPQTRERVFVVGSREGILFRFPKPTHRSPDENVQRSLPTLPVWSNAWDAIGDLEMDDDPQLVLRGKWADLLPSIPEGSNYLFHTARGKGENLFGWRRRYWSFLLKLAKAQPSWTIQAQPGPAVGPFHWKNRRLSARELCRLQTIPDDYFVRGDLRAVQKQLGNAVPSALAETLARQLRIQLFGEQDVSPNALLTPNKRQPVPKPEVPTEVPEKYMHLVGEHEPHPGTGLGYAARAR